VQVFSLLQREIDHENILTIKKLYGWKEPDSELYTLAILTESGESSLFNLLECYTNSNIQFTNEEIEPNFLQCIKALRYMHESLEQHHGNIKPENIILVDEIWKISEFGFGAIAAEGERRLSSSSAQVVSSFYLAPEKVNRP